ncbi:MAG: hypothetical protein IKU08_09175 [Clostridia bacterium]|nr:hypothetical protein [Clostridia bacterium]
MTKNELYNIRYIRIEIARINSRIESLEAAAEQTVAGSGNGRSSGISDKVGNNAAKIADLKTLLEKHKNKIEAEECAVMRFLSELENARLRLIIQLFFVDCKSWQEVAAIIGGDETENSCKQYFKRKMAIYETEQQTAV